VSVKSHSLQSALVLLLVACGAKSPEVKPPAQSSVAVAKPAAVATRTVSREEFNRLAVLSALPLFWKADANANGVLDPDELGVYWAESMTSASGRSSKLSDYVEGNKFTAVYRQAYDSIVSRKAAPADASAVEIARLTAVEKELSQGIVTFVGTDLHTASAVDKQVVMLIVEAASIVEKLYGKQMGNFDVKRFTDSASNALFFRNQSPKCQAAMTQNDPACTASISPVNYKLSGLYPQELLKDPKFCEALSKTSSAAAKNSEDAMLMDPFTVVRGNPPKPVPYTTEYKAEMLAVSQLLSKASALLETVPAELAFKNYLNAAARAFQDNKWFIADEAWAKMGANNSKYYLRIGPDEVYAEPCSTKALFHVSFGLINQASVKWQTKLDPLKTEMENALAAQAGAPYKARKVTFKLPDFMDVALNAGDARPPIGATIGQSLPNFGPVANEGRGRTVAMTNFYQDPDSLASTKRVAESLFCEGTMKEFTLAPEPQLMSTVLHEAAHNLGPAHQYKTPEGKTDRESFGGPLASTLEELKAQTAAMFFAEWLTDRKELERGFTNQAHIRDIFWQFGHISRGMYDEDKHPKNYSQLAAVQFGALMKDGAITWNASETAGNKTDKGCYAVDLAKVPATVKSLMKVVAGIKGRGDKQTAEALLAEFVDVSGEKKEHLERIRDRVLRSPKPSFVYGIRFE
jgi:hypothetical protein